MTTLLVLGASGRIGDRVVVEAAARGFVVRAASREPPNASFATPGILPWKIDLEEASAIAQALAGAVAVVSCLGPRNDPNEGARFAGIATRLVDAMTDSDCRRLILLAGAGVRRADDRRGLGDRLVSALVRVAARGVVEAKQAEFDVVAISNLDWTALRPGFVTDGPTAAYRLDREAPGVGARATRATVATALVDQVTDRSWGRGAPFIWTPRDMATSDRET